MRQSGRFKECLGHKALASVSSTKTQTNKRIFGEMELMGVGD
jgi:hypothetical protein